MSHPLHITDENFETEVLKSDKPVLVDFWATWCGPCRMIAPIIEDLAGEYEGKVVIGKMDVDSNQMAPQKYGIRSIPTILIFKGGEMVDTIIGAVSKQYIAERLEAHSN
ncbi:MAG: hypothetical protein RL348_994 [Bacteroidota bacterium]|jgi:thioredoxin 1